LPFGRASPVAENPDFGAGKNRTRNIDWIFEFRQASLLDRALKSSDSGCSKRFQMRGAREIEAEA
jgi:hypothetical protein